MAVFLLAVGVLHLRPGIRGRLVGWTAGLGAAGVLAGIAVPETQTLTALILVAVVVVLVLNPWLDGVGATSGSPD